MNRAGTSRALQEIEKTIPQEQSTEELLAMLSRLLEVAEATMDGSRIDIVRMNQLADYLAEIRHLLDKLGSDPAVQGVYRAAKDMAGRYRDLEGRVKEIRNDRASMGTVRDLITGRLPLSCDGNAVKDG